MEVIDRLKAAGVRERRPRDASMPERAVMQMDVTDVLRDRMARAGRARSGWSSVSVALHMRWSSALLVFAPGSWLGGAGRDAAQRS